MLGIDLNKPNEKGSSHSGKKFHVNEANQNPYVKSTWVCFRAGWKMKMVHTIFDYLVGNMCNDRQVARCISGWNIPEFHGKLGGGRPPNIICLLILPLNRLPHGRALRKMRDSMFSHFPSIDSDAANLLFGSILRYLPKVIDMLSLCPIPDLCNPVDEYGGWPRHKFVQRLVYHGVAAGIPPEEVKPTLEAWHKVVLKDFVEKNFAYLDYQTIKDASQGLDIRVDPRCVMGTIESLSRQQAALNVKVERGVHAMERLTSANREQNNKINELIKINRRLVALLPVLPEQDEPNTSQMVDNDTLTRSVIQTMNNRVVLSHDFPTKMQHIKMPGSLVSCYRQGWYKLFEHKRGKKKNDNEAKIPKQVKHCMKFAIEFSYLFLDEHIPELPSNASSGVCAEATDWINNISKIIYEKVWPRMMEWLLKHGCTTHKLLERNNKNFGFNTVLDKIKKKYCFFPKGPWKEGEKFVFDGHISNIYPTEEKIRQTRQDHDKEQAKLLEDRKKQEKEKLDKWRDEMIERRGSIVAFDLMKVGPNSLEDPKFGCFGLGLTKNPLRLNDHVYIPPPPDAPAPSTPSRKRRKINCDSDGDIAISPVSTPNIDTPRCKKQYADLIRNDKASLKACVDEFAKAQGETILSWEEMYDHKSLEMADQVKDRIYQLQLTGKAEKAHYIYLYALSKHKNMLRKLNNSDAYDVREHEKIALEMKNDLSYYKAQKRKDMKVKSKQLNRLSDLELAIERAKRKDVFEKYKQVHDRFMQKWRRKCDEKTRMMEYSEDFQLKVKEMETSLFTEMWKMEMADPATRRLIEAESMYGKPIVYK